MELLGLGRLGFGLSKISSAFVAIVLTETSLVNLKPLKVLALESCTSCSNLISPLIVVVVGTRLHESMTPQASGPLCTDLAQVHIAHARCQLFVVFASIMYTTCVWLLWPMQIAGQVGQSCRQELCLAQLSAGSGPYSC